MRLDGTTGMLAWWSPDPRGVLPLDQLRASRSLRSSARQFVVRVDADVEGVLRACADPSRPGGWIGDDFIDAYLQLHEMGWVHTVETWTRTNPPQLAGGLYGVSIGGLFAGESMFHRQTDASKVALMGLVDILSGDEVAGRLLDVQWLTAHLASLGAVEVSRRRFLRRLRGALALPPPAQFSGQTPREDGVGQA